MKDDILVKHLIKGRELGGEWKHRGVCFSLQSKQVNTI